MIIRLPDYECYSFIKYHCCWHYPELWLQLTSCGNWEKHIPGSCANNALPFILSFDGIELEINKLGNIANERENLANTVVY